MVQPLWKIVWRFLKKLKIKLLYDPAMPPKRTEIRVLKRHLFICVHSGIIYHR